MKFLTRQVGLDRRDDTIRRIDSQRFWVVIGCIGNPEIQRPVWVPTLIFGDLPTNQILAKGEEGLGALMAGFSGGGSNQPAI